MTENETRQNKSSNARLPLVITSLPGSEALNSRLRDYLTGLASETPGRESNLSGGSSYFENKWLSAATLHTSENSDLQKLAELVEETANRSVRKTDPSSRLSITSMWCIVSRRGMAGSRHNHAGRLSGAYYVDTGSSGAADGGLMQFYQHPELPQPSHSLAPESGQVFLFPSSLEHSVSCYEGSSPRIVIAFNLS
jgi:uncharacterized protein (TIGR02466 family)